LHPAADAFNKFSELGDTIQCSTVIRKYLGTDGKKITQTVGFVLQNASELAYEKFVQCYKKFVQCY
jgi:hypothetical protein